MQIYLYATDLVGLAVQSESFGVVDSSDGRDASRSLHRQRVEVTRVGAVPNQERAGRAAAQPLFGVRRRQLGDIELTVVQLVTVRHQPSFVALRRVFGSQTARHAWVAVRQRTRRRRRRRRRGRRLLLCGGASGMTRLSPDAVFGGLGSVWTRRRGDGSGGNKARGNADLPAPFRRATSVTLMRVNWRRLVRRNHSYDHDRRWRPTYTDVWDWTGSDVRTTFVVAKTRVIFLSNVRARWFRLRCRTVIWSFRFRYVTGTRTHRDGKFDQLGCSVAPDSLRPYHNLLVFFRANNAQ